MEYVDYLCHQEHAQKFLGLKYYIGDDTDSDSDLEDYDDERDDEVFSEEETIGSDDESDFSDDDDDDEESVSEMMKHRKRYPNHHSNRPIQPNRDGRQGAPSSSSSLRSRHSSSSQRHDDSQSKIPQVNSRGSTVHSDLKPSHQTKTTPLFEAIDSHYWSTVTSFLTTGQWATHTTRSSHSQSQATLAFLQDQARQWSISRSKGQISYRRLPLHAALQNGAPLPVVRRLVALYKHGIRSLDAHGNLPLHLAFRFANHHPNNPNSESAQVIAFIYECYPEAVVVQNNRGLLPMDCLSPVASSGNAHRAILLQCQNKARGLTRKDGQPQEPVEALPINHKTQILASSSSKALPNSSSINNKATFSSIFPTASTNATVTSKEVAKRTNSASSTSSKKRRSSFKNVVAKVAPMKLPAPITPASQSDHDISELKKELQELRRVGSTTTSSRAVAPPKEDPSSLEGWMTMLPTLFATANEEYPDDEVDNVVVEPKTEDEKETKSLSMSRWKQSFKNLATSNNKGDDDDAALGDESVEVDTNASVRSASASSTKGKKHRRRISVNNPFRKRHKTDPTSRDTSGNVSLSDKSTSRFSLSAVPGAAKKKKRTSSSSSSFFSGGSVSQKSISTKKSTSSTAKKLFSSNWMKRRSSTESNNREDGNTNESIGAGGLFSSNWMKRRSSTESNNHVDGHRNESIGAGGLFAAAWNMGAKPEADDVTTPRKKTKKPAADQTRSSIFGASKTTSATPTLSGSSSNQQQSSFLGNKIIQPSDSGGQEGTNLSTKKSFKSIRKTLSKAMKKSKSNGKSKDEGEFMDDEALVGSRFESHDDNESISSASSSEFSRSTGSQSISSVSEGTNSSDDLSFTNDDDDDDDNDFVSGSGLPQVVHKDALVTARSGSSDKKNKINELSKASSGKLTFRGFPKKKSSDEQHAKTQVDVSALVEKMEQTTLRSRNEPFQASHLHDFSHVESANHKRQTSTSSLDASVARSVLPKKDDWRSEYKEYISSQNSVGTADKSQASKKKKKRGAKIRGFIKKSHRRLKSMDGRKQPDADAKHTRQTSGANDILKDLEGGSTLLLDTASTSFHRRERSYSKSQVLPTEKDASTESTGPVVSESTLKTSDQSNVFLVRVHF